MRIDELQLSQAKTLNKNFDNARPGDIENYLYSIGYEKLDNGAHARVYGRKDSTIVIKVLTTQDTAILDYYDFIKKNPANKHYPKVSRRIQYRPGLYIFLMEKLYPQRQLDTNQCMDLEDYVMQIDDPSDDESTAEGQRLFAMQYPTLTDAIYKIYKVLGGKYSLDLHETNILQRADGTLVITDPLN